MPFTLFPFDVHQHTNLHCQERETLYVEVDSDDEPDLFTLTVLSHKHIRKPKIRFEETT